jgi:hypothetical protein
MAREKNFTSYMRGSSSRALTGASDPMSLAAVTFIM